MKPFYIAIKDADFTKRFQNNEKNGCHRIMIDFLVTTRMNPETGQCTNAGNFFETDKISRFATMLTKVCLYTASQHKY